MSTLEKNWWARVHHYSHLYDFDDSGSQIRTPSQKFIFMGKSAAIRLVKMNLLADEEAETFSSSVLTSITPGTLNGAAFAWCIPRTIRTPTPFYKTWIPRPREKSRPIKKSGAGPPWSKISRARN